MAQITVYDEIRSMLEANFPLIYLATTEYNRVMQKVRSICFDLGYKFNTWDSVDGLMKHTSHPGGRLKDVMPHEESENTKDSMGLLEFIRNGLVRQGDKSAEVFVLEDFHKFFSDRQMPEMLRKLSMELKDGNKHLVFISPFTQFPAELDKYITLKAIPLPDKDDLTRRLDFVAGKDADINPDLKKYLVDSALGLTDTEADLAFRLAKNRDGFRSMNAVQIISSEKEQIIRKSGILDYIKVDASLESSVGGLDSLKKWLTRRSKAFELKAKDFGLKEPKGILLLGVPGCGKSLTAKCIAAEWKQPLLKLDIGKVFSQYVGSSENNIREAINTAEAVAPCVLWIDEIEKGLATQGEHDGGTSTRVFSTILTWMQEKTKPVFVVATANDISSLPPELLRKGRFDEIFFVDLPTRDERKNIFRIHLSKNHQGYGVDLDTVAARTRFFNGAEIEETVKEAMFIAYVNNPNAPAVTTADLLEASRNVIPLAQTMKTKIDALRQWAQVRARKASSCPNDESVDNTIMVGGQSCRIPQTRSEKNEDIF
ncbi:MAG: AAA family ATPase [Candidatus Methanomethylophilaceae archaeon]|nr:AAA family ATPase [Candidatus Methanomethylophilaceae archaeon]